MPFSLNDPATSEEISQQHDGKYFPIGQKHGRYLCPSEMMGYLVHQVGGTLHGFTSEPDPGEGDKVKCDENFPAYGQPSDSSFPRD